MDNEEKAIIRRDILRERFLKYTRQAYRMIPKIECPYILDIGCGTGILTLELARLSKGKVIAIDIDRNELQKLKTRIAETKLQKYIQVKQCSFQEMNFPDESFDIIWAEGVGGFISIKLSLQEWNRFIKLGGFLVLHDDARRISNNLNTGSQYNYLTIGHFYFPKNAWWEQYYQPLETQLNNLREISKYRPETSCQIKQYQKEINTYKKDPQQSGFIIYQKM